MHLFADFRQVGDRIDHILIKIFWVRRRIADALDTLNGIQALQQMCERTRLVEKLAVGVDGLAQQGHFAGSE